MKKFVFLIPAAGILLSGCQLINDTMNGLDNNRQQIEWSTQAINENADAIEQANQTISENRRQLDAINAVLDKVSKS